MLFLNYFLDNPLNDKITMKNKQQYFETIVRTLANDLFRYAYWLCNDRSIADDLVQETFLRAWKSIDKLNDQQAVKSWLFTIVRRENARRFERKQFDLVDIENTSVADESIADYDKLIQQKQLHNAIKELDSDYKDPLLMQTIGGFKTEEIALILGMNLNTVNTRLFRAKKQLKEKMTARTETQPIAFRNIS